MDETTKKIDYQAMLWDILGIAWRRKFFVIFPTIIGACVSIYLIKTLPKIYESSTLILVEGQKVPDSIVKSAVSGSAQDRLSTIKQQILSRSFLQRVIDKFELYQDGSPSYLQRILGEFGINPKTASAGDKLEVMRKSIQITTKGRRRLESFSVSYTGKDPVTVMDVTNELASAVIEENLKIREAFIEGATDFLDVELSNLKAELERQEKRVGDYKRMHLGELPGQLDSNLRALDRFQLNLDSIQISKKAAQDRIIDLERMLDSSKRQLAQVNRSIGMVDIPIGEGGPLPSSPLVQRLIDRRQELDNLLTEYSEDYPDVRILRRNIRALEKQVARAEIDQSLEPIGETESSSALQAAGAVGRVGAEEVMALQRQIGKANDEFNYLVKREKEIRQQIQLYERRVENTPKREQEMVIMSRDYDNTAANYQSLLNKKLNAQISENLEKRQKGEQFRIIDSANLPERPIKPNKLLIALMGIVGGLGVGIGLVYIREQLDNSIRKPEEVERITSVLVLAEIPDFSDVVTKNKKVVDLEKFADRKKQLRRQEMG